LLTVCAAAMFAVCQGEEARYARRLGTVRTIDTAIER